MTVAALYVDPAGVYADLPDVEIWDEARDARLYAGPWPVVAHPPCARWSRLAHINQRRLPDYRFGDDDGCFAAALEAVRTYGGVLEHPALSGAWRHFGLPRPLRVGGGWTAALDDPGWVCEVSQGAYGHRAKKLTWLYCVGVRPEPLDWRVRESDMIVSGFTHQAKGAHIACENRRIRPREAAATPVAFRDVLLGMARSVRLGAAA